MAYIYAADIFCDACGSEIRKRIFDEGNAPESFGDETSYDSDEFPKRCGDDEEADCPTNCGNADRCLEAEILPSGDKIGKQFGELTSVGVDYLLVAIANGGEIAEFWAEHYADYL